MLKTFTQYSMTKSGLLNTLGIHVRILYILKSVDLISKKITKGDIRPL